LERYVNEEEEKGKKNIISKNFTGAVSTKMCAR
jgi:hypothetical protein